MKPWFSAAGLMLASIGVAQAQSIECTFLNRVNAEPLYRWTVKLGPKPSAHRWTSSDHIPRNEDEDREIMYVKHAKRTNTAVVIIKNNYKKDDDELPERVDFDDTVLLINFALNAMTVTTAGQATDPDAKAGREFHRPVNFMDVCKRLD